MLRSLMTAVTGVRAHQTMLDVTGNNIANANTMGFKKDFTLFSDLMYQTSKSASAPNGSIGGINPAQVGLGVQVAAIETIHTQGGASYTGNQSDMMIQGTGFFVYDNGSGGQLYSRSGATARDAKNDLVQSGTGYYIQGYAMEKDPLNPGQYNRASDLSNVNIPLGKKLEPNATSVIKYQCNLDSRSGNYLPYGYPDLPYNAVCGWPGNPAGTAKIDLLGGTYDVSFLTNINDTVKDPAKASENGENYLSIRIGQGADDMNPTRIELDMFGIDTATGKPKLMLDNERSTPYTLPGTTTIIVPTYDDETGILKIKDVYGATIFQHNVKAAMNYDSFNLSYTVDEPVLDKDGNPIKREIPTGAYDSSGLPIMQEVDVTRTKTVSLPVLAEFNEGALEGGSDLSKTEATLTMWYEDYKTNEAGERVPQVDDNGNQLMARATAVVHFNPDGTFDYVEPAVGFPDEYYFYDTNLSEDANVTAMGTDKHMVRIGVGNGGNAIVIQNGIVTTGTVGEKTSSTIMWDTTGQINQGGFHQTKQTIYDCNGNDYTLEVNFKKITENRWRWEAFLLDKDGKQVTTATCEDGTSSSSSFSDLIPEPRVGEIAFCGCGPICDPLTTDITIPFSLAGMPNSTITLNFGGDGDKLYGVTQYASETTTKAVYQDGYPMGVMEDYSIATDGTITGIYSNGQNIPLYRVAIATFANQQGLDKVGDTMFRSTVNSGNANIDPAGMNGKGSIMGQNLEMSNVDLTEEFTHLIVAQRGFQANTRVITTSDQILEEVVNLKR